MNKAAKKAISGSSRRGVKIRIKRRETKVSLTGTPLKMTGGDCHDTLMPFSVPVPGPVPLPLPNPAISGPTGILTGAVAWNMDNHGAMARRGHDRKGGGGGRKSADGRRDKNTEK